jgi:hypothetical protein
MTTVKIPLEVGLWPAEDGSGVEAIVDVDPSAPGIKAAKISFDALIEQLIDWHSTLGPDKRFQPSAQGIKELTRVAKSLERNARRLRELLANV